MKHSAPLKVIFFGLGSIGQRHLRLLQDFDPSLEFYAFRSGKSANPHPNNVKALTNWSEIKEVRPQVAFICNPTSLHIETALQCARHGMALFIEKPLGDSLENLEPFTEAIVKQNLTTYIAYPLRFHPGIEFLKNYLDGFDQTARVRMVTSSYLPDWRPGTDHLLSYSAHRKLGGGVILDLSHELDLAEYLCGPVRKISGEAGRAGDVTVDAEDYAQLKVETARFDIEIKLDINSRTSERWISIEVKNKSIHLDILSGSLKIKTPEGIEEKIFQTGRDDAYRKQLSYFFSNIGNERMMNNVVEATPLFQQIVKFRDGTLQ